MLVLRVARRRTTWEASPVDELIKVEFRDRSGGVDLCPSVYEVGEGDVLRTIAEHCASCDITPRNLAVDLAGREVVATPGETRFAFTNQAHREMRFRDIDDLRSYLEQSIIPQLAQRRRDFKLSEVKAYTRSQREAQDPEWVDFLSSNPKWPSS